MGLRRRRERREERRDGDGDGPTNRYRMREKLISIGDDFYIENAAGRRAYHIDGKALRVRNTLNLNDMQGNTLYQIQARIARIRDTMAIEQNGRTVATVKKAMIAPLRSRYSISAPNGDLNAQGNILNHEYQISRGGNKVAEVSRKWFRVRDTYGIEIEEGEDHALILAVTVVIDQLEGVRS